MNHISSPRLERRSSQLTPSTSHFNIEDCLLSHKEARRFLFPQFEDLNFVEEEDGCNWGSFSRILLRTSLSKIINQMSEVKRNNLKKASPKRFYRRSSQQPQSEARHKEKTSDTIKNRVLDYIQDTAFSQSQKLCAPKQPVFSSLPPKPLRNPTSDSTILQAHRLRRPPPMFKIHKRSSPYSTAKYRSGSTYTPPCFSPSMSLLRILRPESCKQSGSFLASNDGKIPPLSPPKDSEDETAPSSLLQITNKLSASCHPFSFLSLNQSKVMTPLVQNSQNTQSQFLAHCIPPETSLPSMDNSPQPQSRLQLFSKHVKSLKIPEPLCCFIPTAKEESEMKEGVKKSPNRGKKQRRPSLLQRSYMHSLINQEKGLRELRKTFVERVVENDLHVQQEESRKKVRKLPYLVRIEARQL